MQSEWIIAGLAVAAFLILLVVFLQLKVAPRYYYRSLGRLFTPAEQKFLHSLQQVLGTDAQLFGKVRVADVLTPDGRRNGQHWQVAFNKIACKHFDFVVCSRDDFTVLCVIELNDRSHEQKSRRIRDRFLRAACRSAGVPLLEIPVRHSYSVNALRKLLQPHLRRKPAELLSMHDDGRSCPECGSPMRVRTARRGQFAGQSFWACSAYPECRHTEHIER